MSVKIDGDIGVIPIGNASGVAFTPVGGIQATNVQAALQEVDAEKQAVLTGARKVTYGSGSGNFTVPAGVTVLTITGCGGGGGGAAYTTATTSGGSGGGGAGFVIGTTVSVTPGQVIPYSVGAGGAGSQITGGSGGAGSNTTFGGLTLQGGGGGVSAGSPGNGGSVTGTSSGGLRLAGKAGQQYNNDGQGFSQGGGGGASFGAGGWPGGPSEGPRAGQLGGGGGGGKNGSGAAGGQGFLTIEW